MAKTTENPQEKPAYQAPVLVDLNTLQRGEGGLPGNCTNGSGAAGYCITGSAGYDDTCASGGYVYV